MGGARHTGQVNIYSFDPSSNQWKTENDMTAFGRRSSLAAGNYAYLFLDGIVRYDPSKNVWQTLENVVPYAELTGHTIAFVLDNELYYSTDASNVLFQISTDELTR